MSIKYSNIWWLYAVFVTCILLINTYNIYAMLQLEIIPKPTLKISMNNNIEGINNNINQIDLSKNADLKRMIHKSD